MSRGWTILCHARRSNKALSGKQCRAAIPYNPIDALWALTFVLQLKRSCENANWSSTVSESLLESSSDSVLENEDASSQDASSQENSSGSFSMLSGVAWSVVLISVSSSTLSNSEGWLESTWWINVRICRLAESTNRLFTFLFLWVTIALFLSTSNRLRVPALDWLAEYCVWKLSLWVELLDKSIGVAGNSVHFGKGLATGDVKDSWGFPGDTICFSLCGHLHFSQPSLK